MGKDIDRDNGPVHICVVFSHSVVQKGLGCHFKLHSPRPFMTDCLLTAEKEILDCFFSLELMLHKKKMQFIYKEAAGQ